MNIEFESVNDEPNSLNNETTGVLHFTLIDRSQVDSFIKNLNAFAQNQGFQGDLKGPMDFATSYKATYPGLLNLIMQITEVEEITGHIEPLVTPKKIKSEIIRFFNTI